MAESSNSQQEDGVWYFAIGSMINPISMSGRGLHPLSSVAAEILNYKIHFYGASGMAEAIPEQGASFHGVLHKMTAEDQQFLDGIERDLTPTKCTCKLYNDDKKLIDAVVYTRPNAIRGEDIDRPPSQRYLDIIIEGCQHFGVKEEYIQWLQVHEAQPRKRLGDLSTLQLPYNLPKMTMDDVVAADGHESRNLFVTLNGKVLNMIFPEKNSFRQLMMTQKAAGVHAWEVHSNLLLYDPMFGSLKSPDDITKECAARIEDRIPGQTNYLGGTVEVVGTIDFVYAEQTQGDVDATMEADPSFG